MKTDMLRSRRLAFKQRRPPFIGWIWPLVGALLTILLGIVIAINPGFTWESHYAVTSKAPFNQPAYYPIQQTLPANLYRPIAPWSGRLILPEPAQGDRADWVWIEIDQAPAAAQDLIGKKVRLEWSQKPEIQRDVAAVTRDIQFTSEVEDLRRTTGNLYPVRLNGRTQVGPLQSMAGARPKDDVMVTLAQPTLTRQANGSSVLQIDLEPGLATGRYYTLAKILGAAANTKSTSIPKACPGTMPCPSDLFRVQHYNPASKQFDGIQETIRIPQQPIDGFGVYSSTPRELEKSPAGAAGWYLYGAQDQAGIFTVQAIQPRSLMQLTPQQVVLGKSNGLDYLQYENWKDTEQRKGTIQTVLIDPTVNPQSVFSGVENAAIAQWKVGDRALMMHLFGGRGGKHGEGSAVGTVTGHFAYGLAEIIRDPFTDELQWLIDYRQVYATNIEGVIAGSNSWANYMGNLQRGWLGTRPVADVIVKLDAIGQDYDFGGIQLSPLSELSRQLRLITDRYRTGDGTGSAKVTPATSCVQDANQALFLTIQTIRAKVESNPAIQQWWSSHPTDPTIKRFERLIALGNDLEKDLAPFGIVRQDWNSNATALAGTQIESRQFTNISSEGTGNIIAALKSWRSILPRQSQDELSMLFLRHGAQLWVLRTNQVGGNNPDIVPIAPTKAFALWTIPGTQIAIVTILFTRILGAIKLPGLWEWMIGLSILLGYGLCALPIGFSQRFFQFKPWNASGWQVARQSLQLLWMPALVEEFVFRILLLPYPRAALTGQTWIFWAVFSLILFVLYHPLNAKTCFKHGNPTFFNPVFLGLAALLGLACTLAYWLTHSLLIITLIHWVAVTTWLMLLGGMEKLYPAKSSLGQGMG
jgi:predicted Abi (CAAX) family protease